MSDSVWRAALLDRWRSEFGDKFTQQELESALDEVALFRRYGERLAQEPLELGEMPFSCVSPALKRGDPQ